MSFVICVRIHTPQLRSHVAPVRGPTGIGSHGGRRGRKTTFRPQQRAPLTKFQQQILKWAAGCHRDASGATRTHGGSIPGARRGDSIGQRGKAAGKGTGNEMWPSEQM